MAADVREKMRAFEQQRAEGAAGHAYQAGLTQGAMGRAYENMAECAASSPRLRERVNMAFYRAERETRNVDRLKELADLLDTNPAIARILELIEETRV